MKTPVESTYSEISKVSGQQEMIRDLKDFQSHHDHFRNEYQNGYA